MNLEILPWCNLFTQAVLRIRIRDPVVFYPPDPGWSNGRIRIRDKQTKFVNSLYTKIGRIRDPVLFYTPDPGWSNGRIRDKTSRIRNTVIQDTVYGTQIFLRGQTRTGIVFYNIGIGSGSVGFSANFDGVTFPTSN
jgi:hypothetical protein